MAVNQPDRLPCGRLVDELWEHIDEPPDAHELGCAYCQGARARLDDLTDVAAQLRRQDESDPAMQISEGVGAAIMQIVHTEVRRARLLPLENPVEAASSATLTISEQTVADVVRAAADEVAGVRSRRCRIEAVPADDQGGSRRAAISVELRIAVAHDVAVGSTSQTIRDRVAAGVEERTGLRVTAVDLRVEDVFDV